VLQHFLWRLKNKTGSEKNITNEGFAKKSFKIRLGEGPSPIFMQLSANIKYNTKKEIFPTTKFFFFHLRKKATKNFSI